MKRRTGMLLLALALSLCIPAGGPEIHLAVRAAGLPAGTGTGTVILSREQPVSGIESEIQAALDDPGNSTVLVAGTRTGVNDTISLQIPGGKTLLWEADYTGSTESYLMSLNGTGILEVAETGTVGALSGGAIQGEYRYEDPRVPDMIIRGTVRGDELPAIRVNSSFQETLNITVDGGRVSNGGSGEHPAICLQDGSRNDGIRLTVSGSGQVRSEGPGGMAIRTPGLVLIRDEAEISAPGTGISGGTIAVEGGTVHAGNTALAGERDIWVSGGSIRAVESGVYAYGRSFGITVSGGMVEATGSGGNAIRAMGNVTVRKGTVQATGERGAAIRSQSSGTTLVEGGIVRASGIAIETDSVPVTVRGGLVTGGTGGIHAITSGAVMVEGGRVETTGRDSIVIRSTKNTTVRGGTVSTDGENGTAIQAVGNRSLVSVEDGLVEASGPGARAISAGMEGEVHISGGTVKGNAEAISSLGRMVRVSGGTVQGGSAAVRFQAPRAALLSVSGGTIESAATAILFQGNLNSVLEISGGTVRGTATAVRFTGFGDTVLDVRGGMVCSAGTAVSFEGFSDSVLRVSGGTVYSTATAIYCERDRNSLMEISGGTIHSTGTGHAIRLTGDAPALTVTGGLVLGCGSTPAAGTGSAVIRTEAAPPVVTAPGTVIAWNRSPGYSLYGAGTGTDLISLPENTARWARQEDKSGILSGTDGFVEVEGVSVAELTAGLSGMTDLQVGKPALGTLTYTLTGAVFGDAPEIASLVPAGLPDWLTVTGMETEKGSDSLRFLLAGTPGRTGGIVDLRLPGQLSAASFPGGGPETFVPVTGTAILGPVRKGDGEEVGELRISGTTATSVVFEPVPALPGGQQAEYAISGTDFPPPASGWQDSTGFRELSPNREYYGFVRSKGNDNYNAGRPAGAVYFRTGKAQLSGSASMEGVPVYGAVLSVLDGEVTSSTPGVSTGQLGAFSYQWWRRDTGSLTETRIPSADDRIYRLTQDDIGCIIGAEISAENSEGTIRIWSGRAVEKVLPAGNPVHTEISQAGRTLADAGLTGTFFNPHNETPVPGRLTWDLPPSTPVHRGRTYHWTFQPGDEAGYLPVKGSRILWPAAAGTGSSGDLPASVSPVAPQRPGMVTVSVPAEPGVDGSAAASVSSETIAAAIRGAQSDSGTPDSPEPGVPVRLMLAGPGEEVPLTLTLEDASLDTLISKGVSRLEIAGAPVSVGLDLAALRAVREQSGEKITIGISPATGLSAEARSLTGDRPVYRILISTFQDGGIRRVSHLGGGVATISIPYTPGPGEAAGHLFGVYVQEDGEPVRVSGSAYDPAAGAVRIPVGHLSLFGVGYTEPGAAFSDIGSHWGKEAIGYVAGRKVLSGTSETTFSPDAPMTRAMLVTALGRLSGVDAGSCPTSSFTDVKAGSAFHPYIECAYREGIVRGTGNQMFAPGRAVSRQETAVILAGYARATGYELPVLREKVSFRDQGAIGSAYTEAVSVMQQAGILGGDADRRFSPVAGATRAEVSSMLARYIRLTTDPVTARGWSRTDSGHYLYYREGRALSGTQMIDGVEYYFRPEGTLITGWVRAGNNWRYYSGNRMLAGTWHQVDGLRYYFRPDGSLDLDRRQ